MPRADLLALTPDDLATLTNRGTVKRAQKELEAGEHSCEIQDDPGGDLVVVWSDGTTCRFPSGKPVHDAVCSSGLTGISRHVVRSVLAYQRLCSERSADRGQVDSRNSNTSAEGSEPDVVDAGPVAQPSAAVWDPGTISDEDLIAQFRRSVFTQARKLFDQGVLAELTRGVKPFARFLDSGCSVRFLVPHDLRYISADCAESLVPTWVCIAVWAFRELPADRLAGLVCLQHNDPPAPEAILKNLDGLLVELCREGISGISETWPQRLGRAEQALRDEGLIWPAELVADLLHQYEMYGLHDARFEPQQVVHIVGELVARTRAITSRTRAVPQSLVRGSKSDRTTEIAGGRMVGIGLGVQPGRRHTTVSAYLQDTDTGSVVAVEKTFVDPEIGVGESAKPFEDLAGTMLMRGVSLSSLASSQLLLKSGRRSPAGQLILPRTASSLTTHPQNFQWEHLKPPLLAENFAQLSAWLETLPPRVLRPRRRTENLHVVAIAGVEDVEFDVAHQRLTARIRDSQGNMAELMHPYHARARNGFSRLAAVLRQCGDQLRFVCGHISSGRTLKIRPICFVQDNGRCRRGIVPWLPGDTEMPSGAENLSDQVIDGEAPAESPIEEFLQRLDQRLSDLLLTGFNGVSTGDWKELLRNARHLGFVRLTTSLAELVEALELRLQTLRWDAGRAIRHAQQLCLLSRIGRD